MDERRNSKTAPSQALSRRRAICSNCRRRKSKCDSRQPQCSTCIAHNSKCQYDKPPSLAYVRSLESKIEKLLEERNPNRPDGTQAETESGEDTPKRSSSNALPIRSPLETHSFEDISELNSPSYQSLEASHEKKRECDRWVSEISVDSHGGVCYHNPTSSFHEAPVKDCPSNSTCSSPNEISALIEGAVQQTNQIKHSLVSNAAAQRQFEAMAVENMAAQNEVPSRVATEFLKFHWCWIHPMFQFVYRPAFTRDMALSSPNQPETSYFSETLLKVLLAHSARFQVQDHPYRNSASTIMGALSQQAHFSLAMRVGGPSSIPTIQALLQQSAREIAFGNSSQAWLYSGMAFRIAIDLGIHLPSERLQGYVKNLTVEDIEIRKRLFWGCYTWDKAISLYLGRMPAFTPPVEDNDPVFMDDFTENDPWMPFYGSDDHRDTRPVYPPQKGHMISCFTALCKLSMILSTIMLEIYGSDHKFQFNNHQGETDTPNTKNSAFIRISSSIRRWWTDLPEVLRLNVRNLPELSPPLHIVSLNLLYHTTSILLHRPFIIGATEFESPAVSRSYQICIAATASIHDLLELLTGTFGYDHTTYLNCYSTYIAATIAVLRFELREEAVVLPDSDVPSEKVDLKFFLSVLQKSATAMPGLTRSVEIVKRHMQAILDRRSKRYLESLFPTSIDGDMNINPSQQAYSSSSLDPQGHYSSFRPEGTASGNHTQTDNSYQSYTGLNFEGLPAFPGQNFSVGTDCTLDQEITDPGLRAVFLGLDSHLTLHHESSDWAYSGFHLGDEMQ